MPHQAKKWHVSQEEGSLTSSAEEVFLANIQMKVFNTKSAVLDMNFLLLPITMVFKIALALVGGVF
jgi:hypothetical protein